MSSRISKAEWKAVYAAAFAIDVIQWILDLFGIGLVINDVADPIIGIGIFGYFELRGVSMTRHPQRLISLAGSYVGEALSDSIVPAWILDVVYIHSDVTKEEAQINEQRVIQEQLQNNTRQPR